MAFILVVTFMFQGQVFTERTSYQTMQACNTAGISRIAELARNGLGGGIAVCSPR